MPTKAIRYVWAFPATGLGLLVAAMALATGGQCRIVSGVIEVTGRIVCVLLKRCVPLIGGASALTLGHVVVGVDDIALESTRDHERVHVRQYERWGPAFIPAYLLASLWLLIRRRDAYFDNPFEQAARRETGMRC